ncbi:MAG: N-acetylmannosamine-6-phosphate 2-epimerase, partial [Anaerolineae bacterium]|nr:N-acetylmannosamine-6-phosphate 2-epimerase [Anaerolineae bacterium]
MELIDLIPQRGIIVSCQADPNTPTESVDMIVAFAESAQMGGACGLRLNSAEHVAAVRARVSLPIIAIQKSMPLGEKVLITGDHNEVGPLADAGAEVIAFDATDRQRPSSLKQIVAAIHQNGALALADIRSAADIARA